MDYALRVDDDLDLFVGEVEKPAGLDDLQPLVHQGCRVHGDLRAHTPRRVGEGSPGRDTPQLLLLPPAEGTAGARDDDPRHRLPVAGVPALVQCGMLTVHGQDGGPAPARLRGDKGTPRHERLLVGKGHGLPGPQCLERRD